MIQRSLFGKHFFVTVGIFLILLFIGFASSIILSQLDHEKDMQAGGPFLFARLVEKQKDHAEFVRTLNEADTERKMPVRWDLINRQGISYVTGHALWPSEELAKITFPTEIDKPLRRINRTGPPRQNIYRVNTSARDEYLVSTWLAEPPQRGRVGMIPPQPPGRPLGWLTFSCLFIAVILASAVSIFILFRNFREKGLIAREVITQLQMGNLKARLPITKIDEVGQLMVAFNTMADELERLVERLRENERSRIELLQELAHDLRTPVASLKNLLEAIGPSGKNLKPELQSELHHLAVTEVEYFEHLVEDLLFLGLVMEPKYKHKSAEVNLLEVLEEQLALSGALYPQVRYSLVKESLNEPVILGDQQSITRLFRNALENAFSFANAQIEVRIEKEDKNWNVFIIDDGPGLNPDALESFGKKRKTRSIAAKKDGRVSIGLGSLIMTTIVKYHLGSITISNGKSRGAILKITLPLA